MQIELRCPSCRNVFKVPPDETGEAVLDRVFADAPGYALGDGETFEDAIFTTLSGPDEVECPRCGQAMQVSEETLGALALTLLGQM